MTRSRLTDHGTPASRVQVRRPVRARPEAETTVLSVSQSSTGLRYYRAVVYRLVRRLFKSAAMAVHAASIARSPEYRWPNGVSRRPISSDERPWAYQTTTDGSLLATFPRRCSRVASLGNRRIQAPACAAAARHDSHSDADMAPAGSPTESPSARNRARARQSTPRCPAPPPREYPRSSRPPCSRCSARSARQCRSYWLKPPAPKADRS